MPPLFVYSRRKGPRSRTVFNRMYPQRYVLLLAAACAAIVATSAFFLRNPSEAGRVRELEMEIAALRLSQKQEASPRLGTVSVDRSTEPASTSAPVEASAVDVESLANQMRELSQAIARLQLVAEDLERRISRSSLALPTRQEQEARLALLEGELAGYRRSNEEAVSQVKTVALKYGVTLEPRFITNVNFPTPLDNKPDFVEARTRAAQNAKILEAVERAYGEQVIKAKDIPE